PCMSEDKKIYLPYLLVELARRKFEGRLVLMEGNVKRSICFRGGKPVNVESNQQKETLGRMLLDQKRIDSGQYERLLDAMMKTGKRAGEVLIQLGTIEPQELFSALEFQCRLKLRNCFTMADFGFSLEEAPIAPENVLMRVEVSAALLDGVHACYSVDRIMEEFPVDEETVFKANQRPLLHPLVLGPREQKLLRTIGSGNSLMKLMPQFGDLQQLLAALYVLHAAGAIEASGTGRPDTSDVEQGMQVSAGEPSTEVSAAVTPPAAEPEEEEIIIDTIEMDEEEIRPPTLSSFASRTSTSLGPELARKLLVMDRADHFELLGIERDADTATIKRAFDAIVEKHGLDDIDSHFESATQKVSARRLLDRLTLAFTTLCNPKKRREYLRAIDKKRDVHPKPDERLLADAEALKGEMALRKKRYQDAIEHFDRAIGTYPDEPSYHFKLGLAGYLKATAETDPKKPLDDAVRKPFLKVLVMDPSHAEARMYLGYISKRNGQMERALKEFESALRADPHNGRAQKEVALLKQHLGR
ncbi:MAG: hypothetical protein D6806_01880, partial [Deltaproteobacteria bacterium]